MTNNDISIASTLLRHSPVSSELHFLNTHARERSMHNNSQVNKSLLLHGALSIARSNFTTDLHLQMTLIAVRLVCRLLNHLLISVCYLMHPLIAQFIARCAIFREEIDESHFRIRPCFSACCQRLRQSVKRKTAWFAN